MQTSAGAKIADHMNASINLVLEERACARLEGRPQAKIAPAAMLRDASQRARIERLSAMNGAAPLLSMRDVGLSSIPNQPRPEERACARLEGRPQARSSQRPSFETLGAPSSAPSSSG